MNVARQVLGRVLVVALAFVTACTSVTDVPCEKLDDRERGRLAGMPGLRVHGYVPAGGEEQEVDAFVRRLGKKGFHFQPVGVHASVPAFTVPENGLEALLLVRPDVAKTLIVIPIAIVALPVVLIFGFAAGGGVDALDGVVRASSLGATTIK